MFIGVARVARSELDILDGAAPDGLAGADHPVTPGSRVACAQTAPGPVLLRFDGSAVATRRARDCRGEDAGKRRLGFHATPVDIGSPPCTTSPIRLIRPLVRQSIPKAYMAIC